MDMDEVKIKKMDRPTRIKPKSFFKNNPLKMVENVKYNFENEIISLDGFVYAAYIYSHNKIIRIIWFVWHAVLPLTLPAVSLNFFFAVEAPPDTTTNEYDGDRRLL